MADLKPSMQCKPNPTLIIGFTCPPTIHFKFIAKSDKCYYKVRQILENATEHSSGIWNTKD